jgi:transcriptional regulator with XRE-family HTH domain
MKMAVKTELESKVASPLGAHLAAIRADRKLSLRRVEELTNKQVSNPYLNQIENGKILQPSPNILFVLSEVYQTSYEKLMELAGYINAAATPNAQHGKLPTLSELNLTEGEERELVRYLKYYRGNTEGKDGEGG